MVTDQRAAFQLGSTEKSSERATRHEHVEFLDSNANQKLLKQRIGLWYKQ